MKFINTEIPDVVLIEPSVMEDHRGRFMELYHVKKFRNAGILDVFVQDNYSISKKNILRGLHYQKKYPQAKLVRCLRGKIFDVAVDIRKGSKYFGKWVAQELSEYNNFQFYIPAGFAHGYFVISDVAEVIYKCSEIYYPEYDSGIIWNDADLSINWPTLTPVLSDKDRCAPTLTEFKKYR